MTIYMQCLDCGGKGQSVNYCGPIDFDGDVTIDTCPYCQGGVREISRDYWIRRLYNFGIRYIERGFCPIPVWMDKRKNPRITNVREYHQKRPSIEQWRKWVNRFCDANIGLITGYHAGLVALDFDSQDDYLSWQGPRGQTWTVATRRGYHVYFILKGEMPNSKYFTNGKEGDELREVLLRAKGGYTIAPPSIHHSYTPYKTVHNLEPLTMTLSDIVAGWLPKSSPVQSQNVTSQAKKYRGRSHFVTPRTQNVTLPGHKVDDFKIENLIPKPEGVKEDDKGFYSVCCPFHDDKKPSAWVNTFQQRFHCHTCGGKYQDAINVYAKIYGYSNREAYAIFKHLEQKQKGAKDDNKIKSD